MPDSALIALLSLLLAFILTALARKRFFAKLKDYATPVLRAEHARFVREEDAQARYRLTPSRLEKVMPPGGEPFDAVFIGSGPGSLACAATMARIGWRCAVFEQGEQLGGGAHVFPEHGYEFETGVHYLGNEKEMRGLLDFLTCGRLELADIGTPVTARVAADGTAIADGDPIPPATTRGDEDAGVMYDNVIVDGVSYNFLAGPSVLLRMLRRRFPHATSQLDAFEVRLAHHLSDAYKTSAAMFFTLKVPRLLEYPMLRWLRTLLQCHIMGRHYFRSTQQTAEELVAGCGVELGTELAAVLLGQYGDSGMRPDKLSAMMHMGVMCHYAAGACYPIGGSGQIPRKLNAVVLAAGGRSFTQASVQSLLMAADGATCRGVVVNGLEVPARVVVSGIGVHRSYATLVRPLADPTLSAAAVTATANLEATTELTVAFIFLFVALDVSSQPADESDARSHNTWIYPSRDYTAMEKAIEAAEPWSVPMPMFVASGSAKDAGWTSTFGDGKKTVVVLSQCPWAWVAPWADLPRAARDKDAGYAAFKARAAEVMMEEGFRKVFPKLEPYIVHKTVGTPLSTNDFLGTSRGECYGRSASPARWLAPELSPYTPVGNLYLTGQDVVTLGLTGAIASGYLTANVLAGYGGWENIVLQREIANDLGYDKLF